MIQRVHFKVENGEPIQVGPTPAWTQLKYHPTQSSLWTTVKRFAVVPAGRGSGKTELAKRRLVRMLPVRKPWSDPRYFYGAPTEQQAKRIAWHHLLRLIPKDWISEVNKSELTITSIFGSTLHVVGLDKPQRIEGVQWDGCVIDESCDIKPGTFDLNILPALVWRNGWCWRIGVPKRHGVGVAEFRKFYEDAAAGKLPDAEAFTWESADIVPFEALEFARTHMDERDYLEQFCAKFLNAGGGVFYSFNRDYNVRPCGYSPDKTILVGSDFNVDPMCWVLCHRFPTHLEVFDELYLRDSNTPAALAALKQRYRHHKGGFEFYGDATSRGRKTAAVSTDYRLLVLDEDIKRMGRTIHYLHSNPPVADRFAATNALIKSADGQNHLFIDPRCEHLITDLELRAYKPGTREPEDGTGKNKLIGHMTDALGYIIYRVFPIKTSVGGRYEIVVSGHNLVTGVAA